MHCRLTGQNSRPKDPTDGPADLVELGERGRDDSCGSKVVCCPSVAACRSAAAALPKAPTTPRLPGRAPLTTTFVGSRWERFYRSSCICCLLLGHLGDQQGPRPSLRERIRHNRNERNVADIGTSRLRSMQPPPALLRSTDLAC